MPWKKTKFTGSITKPMDMGRIPQPSRPRTHSAFSTRYHYSEAGVQKISHPKNHTQSAGGLDTTRRPRSRCGINRRRANVGLKTGQFLGYSWWLSICRTRWHGGRLRSLLLVILGLGINRPEIVLRAAYVLSSANRSHHGMVLVVVFVHSVSTDQLQVWQIVFEVAPNRLNLV